GARTEGAGNRHDHDRRAGAGASGGGGPRLCRAAMIAVWVVIPVKPLVAGKSRLSGVLRTHQRRILNERLLRHVLGVAVAVVGAPRVVVVSADPAVHQLARR